MRPAATSSPAAASGELPAGWRTFSSGRILFEAPAELADQHAQGEDSLVGLYTSADLHVAFDFGWYSDDSFIGHFDGQRMRGGTLEELTLEGRPARLGTWHDDRVAAGLPHVCALYVGNVDRVNPDEPRTSLDFRVTYRDASQAELARRVALSVRIAPLEQGR